MIMVLKWRTACACKTSAWDRQGLPQFPYHTLPTQAQSPNSEPCSSIRSLSVRTSWRNCWAAVAHFLCLCSTAVAGIFCRIVRVYLGTYRSKKKEVQRAGLVADLNAIVLAAAVILLLTSRQAFHEAEKATDDLVWHTLLSDSLLAACATLSRTNSHHIAGRNLTLVCSKVQEGQRVDSRHPIDVSNMTQLMPVLRVLDGCGAFEYALGNIFNNTPCYWKASGASDLFQRIMDLAKVHPPVSANIQFTRATYISGCDQFGQELPLRQPWIPDLCGGTKNFTSTGIPLEGNFFVRWVDNWNRGMYLGLRPHCAWNKCFDSMESWKNVTFKVQFGDKDVSVRQNGPDDFCPPDGNMDLGFGALQSYHCIRGVEIGSMDMLNNEMTLIKGDAHVKFAYFWCLSYDELFGVYVGIFGFFFTVLFTTAVVLCADVCGPMLRAGGKSWSGKASVADGHDAVAGDAEAGHCVQGALPAHPTAAGTPRRGGAFTGAGHGEALGEEGDNAQQRQLLLNFLHAHAPNPNPSRQVNWSDVLDVVLRVLASIVLGTAITVLIIYLPMLGFNKMYIGKCGNE